MSFLSPIKLSAKAKIALFESSPKSRRRKSIISPPLDSGAGGTIPAAVAPIADVKSIPAVVTPTVAANTSSDHQQQRDNHTPVPRITMATATTMTTRKASIMTAQQRQQHESSRHHPLQQRSPFSFFSPISSLTWNQRGGNGATSEALTGATNGSKHRRQPDESPSCVASQLQHQADDLQGRISVLAEGEDRIETQLKQQVFIRNKQQEHELQRLRSKLREIKTGLVDIEQERRALTERAKLLEEEKNSLRAELHNREEEVSRLSRRCASQADRLQEVSRLLATNQELAKNVQQLRMESVKRAEDDASRFDDLRRELHRCQAERDALVRRLDRVQKDSDSVSRNLQACLETLEKLLQEKQEWEEERKLFESRANFDRNQQLLVHQQQQQHRNASSRRVHFSVQHEPHREQQLREDLRERDGEIQRLEALLEEKEKDFRHLQQLHEDSEKSLIGEVQARDDKIRALESSVRQRSIECENLKAEMSEMEQTQQQLLSHRKDRDKQWEKEVSIIIDDYEEQLASLQEHLQDKERTVSVLKDDVAATMERLMESTHAIQKAEDDRALCKSLMEDVSTLEQERGALHETLHEKETEIAELSAEILRLEIEKEFAQNQPNAAADSTGPMRGAEKGFYETPSKVVHSQRVDIASLQEQLQRSNEKVRRLENDVDSHKTVIDSKAMAISALTQRFQESQAKMARTINSDEELQAEMCREIQHLREDLAAQEDELEKMSLMFSSETGHLKLKLKEKELELSHSVKKYEANILELESKLREETRLSLERKHEASVLTRTVAKLKQELEYNERSNHQSLAKHAKSNECSTSANTVDQAVQCSDSSARVVQKVALSKIAFQEKQLAALEKELEGTKLHNDELRRQLERRESHVPQLERRNDAIEIQFVDQEPTCRAAGSQAFGTDACSFGGISPSRSRESADSGKENDESLVEANVEQRNATPSTKSNISRKFNNDIRRTMSTLKPVGGRGAETPARLPKWILTGQGWSASSSS